MSGLRELLSDLERTEFSGPERLRAIQLSHLERLAVYAAEHSPLFAARLASAGLIPSDLREPGVLSALPVLTRRALQAAGDAAFVKSPDSHGPVGETRTSGSTGEPVRVRRSAAAALFAHAMTLRALTWHGVDLSGRLCRVGAKVAAPERRDQWGAPASAVAKTGPSLSLPVTCSVAELLDWIDGFDPTLLVIYPSTLEAIISACEERGQAMPSLRHVLSVGESLPVETRRRAASALGVTLIDVYSSEEAGCIAVECPESGVLHVMAEALIAEVLDDEDVPCGPGQTGRVVVTDLHNYATPLIRYEIGDLAEVAPPCSCGRTLPAWTRVLGRTRNLVKLPDGSRRWPLTGFHRCREIAPVRQFQCVQHDQGRVEIRLVVERPLSPGEERGLGELFQSAIGHAFDVQFTYLTGQIPPGASGKHEEFICHVP